MVKLYSTNCPRCMVLEKKLEKANVGYEKIEVKDPTELIEAGFKSAPILEVDGNKMNYTDAIEWIRSCDVE